MSVVIIHYASFFSNILLQLTIIFGSPKYSNIKNVLSFKIQATVFAIISNRKGTLKEKGKKFFFVCVRILLKKDLLYIDILFTKSIAKIVNK